MSIRLCSQNHELLQEKLFCCQSKNIHAYVHKNRLESPCNSRMRGNESKKIKGMISKLVKGYFLSGI